MLEINTKVFKNEHYVDNLLNKKGSRKEMLFVLHLQLFYAFEIISKFLKCKVNK